LGPLPVRVRGPWGGLLVDVKPQPGSNTVSAAPADLHVDPPTSRPSPGKAECSIARCAAIDGARDVVQYPLPLGHPDSDGVAVPPRWVSHIRPVDGCSTPTDIGFGDHPMHDRAGHIARTLVVS